MLFHLFGLWSNAHPEFAGALIPTLIRRGWLGVELFFVVSGYCIAERLARQYRSGGSVGRFLLDRGWRILPVYWVTLVLLFIIRLASMPFNHPLPAASFADWMLAIPVLEPWLHRPSVLTVSWTLACELFYYGLAALCLQAARFARRPWVGFATAGLLGAAGLLIPALAGQIAWQLFPHFLLGVAVWALVRGLPPASRLPAGFVVCAAVFGLAWVPGLLAEPLRLQVAALFAFVLIALQRWDDAIAGSRFLRPLGAIGVFSYSLYLMHLPLGSPLTNLLARVWPPAADTFALVPLLVCTLTTAGAWCFYRAVEKPLEARRHQYLKPSPAPHPL